MCPDPEDDYEVLGCNIRETSPAPAPRLPCLYPDPVAFKANADPRNLRSKFFQMPPEVRQAIYLEVWRSAGLSQHIFLHNGSYTCSPCIVAHDADESRGYFDCLGLKESWDVEVDDGLNLRRLQSPWGNHWKCEEVALRARKMEGYDLLGSGDDPAAAAALASVSVPSPFLATLLTCKQMYLDCSASIYSSLVFSFTAVRTANDFLFTRPLFAGHMSVVHSIRAINLACRLEFGHANHPHVVGRLEAWAALLQGLPSLQSLVAAHCWLDSPYIWEKENLGSNSRSFLSLGPELARIMRIDFPMDAKSVLHWQKPPGQACQIRPRAFVPWEPESSYGLFD